MVLLNRKAAPQPSFSENIFNGYPGISFDGIDDFLSISDTVLGTNNFTVFAVARGSATLVTVDPYSGLFGQRFLLGAESNGSNFGSCVSLGSNGVGVFDYQSTSFFPFEAFYAHAIDTTCPIVVKYASKSISMYFCGTLVAGGGTGGVPSPDIVAPTMIGMAEAGGPFEGDVAEILIYDRALTDTERATVESYLQSRYDCLPVPTPTPSPTPGPLRHHHRHLLFHRRH
ncbi:MAG: hypothetical protein WDN28_07215 [Chthoniobacter sp.]